MSIKLTPTVVSMHLFYKTKFVCAVFYYLKKLGQVILAFTVYLCLIKTDALYEE